MQTHGQGVCWLPDPATAHEEETLRNQQGRESQRCPERLGDPLTSLSLVPHLHNLCDTLHSSGSFGIPGTEPHTDQVLAKGPRKPYVCLIDF